MPEQPQDICDGTLTVRSSKDGDTLLVSLCGELDLANSDTAEAALTGALKTGEQVIVDMSELEFIDSTGIALLVAALRGDGVAGRLRFIPSRFSAVSRVLQVTGIEERLPLADSSPDGMPEASSPA